MRSCPISGARVEGLVLTLGAPAMECVGPLLWHVSLPRESLDHEGILLETLRAVIAMASGFRNEATVAASRNACSPELAQRSEDYQRVTNALQPGNALCRQRKQVADHSRQRTPAFTSRILTTAICLPTAPRAIC